MPGWDWFNPCEPIKASAECGEATVGAVQDSMRPCTAVACGVNDSESLATLMERRTNQERTLHRLVRMTDDCVGLLKVQLDRGVDVDHRDELGRTALMHAAWRGHVKSIEVLILYGKANIKLKTATEPGLDAIGLAEAGRQNEAVNLLSLARAKQLCYSAVVLEALSTATSVSHFALPAGAHPIPTTHPSGRRLSPRSKSPQRSPRRNTRDAPPRASSSQGGFKSPGSGVASGGSTARGDSMDGSSGSIRALRGVVGGDGPTHSSGMYPASMSGDGDSYRLGTGQFTQDRIERTRGYDNVHYSELRTTPRGGKVEEQGLKRVNQAEQFEQMKAKTYHNIDCETQGFIPKEYSFLTKYPIEERMHRFGIGHEEIVGRRQHWLRRNDQYSKFDEHRGITKISTHDKLMVDPTMVDPVNRKVPNPGRDITITTAAGKSQMSERGRVRGNPEVEKMQDEHMLYHIQNHMMVAKVGNVEIFKQGGGT